MVIDQTSHTLMNELIETAGPQFGGGGVIGVITSTSAGGKYNFFLHYKVEFCGRDGQNSQFLAPAAPVGTAGKYFPSKLLILVNFDKK